MLYRVKAVSQNSHSFPMEGQGRKRNQRVQFDQSIQGKLRSANQLMLLAMGFKIIGMLKISHSPHPNASSGRRSVAEQSTLKQQAMIGTITDPARNA